MPNIPRVPPTLAIERDWLARGRTVIAGVDEVGVGAIAGPVVAAAVVLPLDQDLDALLDRMSEVRDSNHTKRYKQERLRRLIEDIAEPNVAVGLVDVSEIEHLDNQNRAAQIARERAISRLKSPPSVVLLDGDVDVTSLTFEIQHVAKVVGGTPSLTIAAASIVARVERGRIMTAYGTAYPGWGFEQHSGYPSPQHMETLSDQPPTPIHHRNHRIVQEAATRKRPKGEASE
jgi:ribonuclease HII